MSLNHNNSMKIKAILFTLLVLNLNEAFAQSAGDYFNRAANEYLYENEQVALGTIDAGLQSYPSDQELLNLREKIQKDKDQKDEQKQQQNQQNQDQKEQEKQEDQQNQEEGKENEQEQNQEDQQEKAENSEDAEKKEQQQQAEQQETEEEGEEMDEPPKSRSEKLEDLNLTEEKARMILEAMKNNEIQYIQQNRRKPSKKPDSTKPDW
jgi:outer membrane biosynthesis protein TonB